MHETPEYAWKILSNFQTINLRLLGNDFKVKNKTFDNFSSQKKKLEWWLKERFFIEANKKINFFQISHHFIDIPSGKDINLVLINNCLNVYIFKAFQYF